MIYLNRAGLDGDCTYSKLSMMCIIKEIIILVLTFNTPTRLAIFEEPELGGSQNGRAEIDSFSTKFCYVATFNLSLLSPTIVGACLVSFRTACVHKMPLWHRTFSIFLANFFCLTQSHPDRPLAAIYDLPRSAISGQRAPVYTELMFLWFQLVFNIFSIIG